MSEQTDQVSEQSSSNLRVRPGSGEKPSVDDTTSFAGLRTIGQRKCPSCGTLVPAQANVCLECGVSLQAPSKMIRCRYCRQPASSVLVLCPCCGRELVAAPPRIVTWGAPLVLVVMFLAIIVTRWESGNPLTWFQSTISQGASLAVEFGDRVEPEVSFVITPAQVARNTLVEASSLQAGLVAPVADTPAESMATGDIVAGDVSEIEQNSAEAAEIVAPVEPNVETDVAGIDSDTGDTEAGNTGEDGDTLETGGGAGEQPAADVAPAATPGPAVTALPTTSDVPLAVVAPDERVTATSTVLASPTVMPTVTTPATVTIAAIASAGDGAVIASVSLPTATGPASIQAPTPTLTPSPVPVVTYEIQAGDTMIAIATRFGISVEALMQANGISANGAYTIQPGQSLIIPGSSNLPPAPTATNTVVVPPTATQATVAAATPTATAQPIRLDAPRLRSPENDTPMSCNSQTTLVWLGVPYIKVEDKYILHVGYVSSVGESGEEEVTWLLYQHVPSARTSWELNGDQYCQYADKEFGRQWRWWVEVVEEVNGDFVSVSPPSDIWGFSWN